MAIFGCGFEADLWPDPSGLHHLRLDLGATPGTFRKMASFQIWDFRFEYLTIEKNKYLYVCMYVCMYVYIYIYIHEMEYR